MNRMIGIGSTLQYAVKFEGLTYNVDDTESVEFTAKFFTRKTVYSTRAVSQANAVIDLVSSGEPDTIICTLLDSSILKDGLLWLHIDVHYLDDTDYKETLEIPLDTPMFTPLATNTN